MSILFYLLVAFTVLDFNVFDAAKDWGIIWRFCTGLAFMFSIIVDVAICFAINEIRKK